MLVCESGMSRVKYAEKLKELRHRISPDPKLKPKGLHRTIQLLIYTITHGNIYSGISMLIKFLAFTTFRTVNVSMSSVFLNHIL